MACHKKEHGARVCPKVEDNVASHALFCWLWYIFGVSPALCNHTFSSNIVPSSQTHILRVVDQRHQVISVRPRNFSQAPYYCQQGLHSSVHATSISYLSMLCDSCMHPMHFMRFYCYIFLCWYRESIIWGGKDIEPPSSSAPSLLGCST